MPRLEVAPGTKQQRWTAMSRLVARTEPSQPIDKPVRTAVTALNLLGIQTSSACGGHRDRRPIQGPMIDIVNERIPAEGESDRYWSSYYRFQSVHDGAEQLKGYLGEFYATRRVTRWSKLVVDEEDRSAVIYNQGNEHRIFQWEGPRRSIGRVRLFFYQRQMGKFGEFLKEKYLNSDE